MKMIKQTTMIMTCLFALGLGCGIVSANNDVVESKAIVQKQSVMEDFNINPEIIEAPEMQNMYGEIVEINNNMVTIKAKDKDFTINAMINQDTYVVNGANGKLKRAASLKVGQKVNVYYSNIMTRSLPPQTKAFAIVIGDDLEKLPLYFEVDQVINSESGNTVRVLNSNHSVIASVNQDACENFASIKKGNKLLVWCDVMTMSIPGQTNATKVIILP